MWTLLTLVVLSLINGISAKANCATQGVSLGELKGSGISGKVFVVNSSTIQVLDFSSQAPTTWSVDQGGPISHIFKREGDFLKPIASTVPPLSNARLVMNIPGGNIKENHKLNVNSGEQTVAAIEIPSSLKPPQPLKLSSGINGWIYNVKTGPITVLDTKTFILPNFSFLGNKPPDGWVFAGEFDPDDGKVHKKYGKKAFVRGHDTPPTATPLKEVWDGTKTIIVDLAEGQTVCDIEYIGVYCYIVGVDFGHMDLKGKISRDVPPHIPQISV